MHAQIFATITLLSSLAIALPTSDFTPRQAAACFVVGDTALPAEVSDSVTSIQNVITCSDSATTISNVPDVTSGAVSFSSIDFSKSSQTPLQFALSEFATAEPLASTDLQTFQDSRFPKHCTPLIVARTNNLHRPQRLPRNRGWSPERRRQSSNQGAQVLSGVSGLADRDGAG